MGHQPPCRGSEARRPALARFRESSSSPAGESRCVLLAGSTLLDIVSQPFPLAAASSVGSMSPMRNIASYIVMTYDSRDRAIPGEYFPPQANRLPYIHIETTIPNAGLSSKSLPRTRASSPSRGIDGRVCAMPAWPCIRTLLDLGWGSRSPAQISRGSVFRQENMQDYSFSSCMLKAWSLP